MSDNKITVRKQTSTTIDLDHESLGHGLHVFRRRALTEVTYPENPDLDTSVLEEDQGIVDDENLALLREGLEAETCGDAWQIMPKFIREELAKKGWDYWRHEGDRGDLISPSHGVYDGFMEGEWSAEDMVREVRQHGQRILVGLNGKVHPVAIDCGADQGFDEGFYDMDILRQVLSKRTDINMSFPYARGYDVAPDGVRYAHFLWQIDEGTLKSVLQTAKDTEAGERPSSNFWSAVFECDALGLRSAGATKQGAYYMGR